MPRSKTTRMQKAKGIEHLSGLVAGSALCLQTFLPCRNSLWEKMMVSWIEGGVFKFRISASCGDLSCWFPPRIWTKIFLHLVWPKRESGAHYLIPRGNLNVWLAKTSLSREVKLRIRTDSENQRISLKYHTFWREAGVSDDSCHYLV